MIERMRCAGFLSFIIKLETANERGERSFAGEALKLRDVSLCRADRFLELKRLDNCLRNFDVAAKMIQ